MLSNILLQTVATPLTSRDIVEIILSSIGILLFIWGLFEAFSSKANKKESVSRAEYLKDMEAINSDIDDFGKDLDSYAKRLDKHENLYHSIDKKLDLLAQDIKYIKINCDKEVCKVTKK